MKLQIAGISICVVAAAIGCNQSKPDPATVQTPSEFNITSDLVFNVEGLT